MFHVNTRSLSKNFDRLQNVLSAVETKFDVVGITETKQQVEKDFITNVDLDGCCVYTQPSNSNAGGVAHYVNNKLVLYFAKLSVGNGFWSNLRAANPVTDRNAITLQGSSRKLKRAELDLKFLLNCCDNNVHPKFVHWKNLNGKSFRKQHQHYRRLLKEEIQSLTKRCRCLREEVKLHERTLSNSTTWMNFMIIKVSINRLLENEALKIKSRLDKKLDALILDKQLKDGIKPNPNPLISNLTGLTLTAEETEVLMLGLKHGLAIRPKETEIIAIVESIWDQLECSDAIKDNYMSKERAKMALRSFAYNYLDLDIKQYGLDSKRIKVLRKLKNKCVILKPDKGSGIVLLKREDYVSSLNKMFLDASKFKKIHPTLMRMNSLQRYLNGLFNKGEISEQEKKDMRPMAVQLGRAHGLPKMHKEFDTIPKFRRIINTTGTPYDDVGKYLAKLLNPLTANEFSLKDSFDATTRIQNIPQDLFDKGYKFISFDVESLFTNVPLAKTINIVLNRVYDQKK